MNFDLAEKACIDTMRRKLTYVDKGPQFTVSSDFPSMSSEQQGKKHKIIKRKNGK
jgi:hypothetical protein